MGGESVAPGLLRQARNAAVPSPEEPHLLQDDQCGGPLAIGARGDEAEGVGLGQKDGAARRCRGSGLLQSARKGTNAESAHCGESALFLKKGSGADQSCRRTLSAQSVETVNLITDSARIETALASRPLFDIDLILLHRASEMTGVSRVLSLG